MAEDPARLFTDHDRFSEGLQVQSFQTAESAQEFIGLLEGPVLIKFIYASGTRHYVWFQSQKRVELKLTKKRKRKVT